MVSCYPCGHSSLCPCLLLLISPEPLQVTLFTHFTHSLVEVVEALPYKLVELVLEAEGFPEHGLCGLLHGRLVHSPVALPQVTGWRKQCLAVRDRSFITGGGGGGGGGAGVGRLQNEKIVVPNSFFLFFLIVYLRGRHRLQEPVFMQSHDMYNYLLIVKHFLRYIYTYFNIFIPSPPPPPHTNTLKTGLQSFSTPKRVVSPLQHG